MQERNVWKARLKLVGLSLLIGVFVIPLLKILAGSDVVKEFQQVVSAYNINTSALFYTEEKRTAEAELILRQKIEREVCCDYS